MMPRHFEILNLALGGHGPKEIAQALGMTPQAVTLITKAPIFQDELARRRSNVETVIDQQLAAAPIRAKQLMEENAFKAAQVHVDLLDPETCADPRVRQGSANAILDRVYGPAGQAKAQNQQVIVLGNDAIKLLQLALAESEGGEKKIVCDVEVS